MKMEKVVEKQPRAGSPYQVSAGEVDVEARWGFLYGGELADNKGLIWTLAPPPILVGMEEMQRDPVYTTYCTTIINRSISAQRSAASTFFT